MNEKIKKILEDHPERYKCDWYGCVGCCDEGFVKGFTAAIELANQKLLEHLRKTIKENTAMIDDFDCKRSGHTWEPDSSMTIMRCERCGIGAHTYKAQAAIDEWEGK